MRHKNGTFYDGTAGRNTSAVFNTGRINSFLYDENNNPEVISRSGSGPATTSRLTYDAMDRVKEYRDPFGKLLQYRFDPAGRLASVTYPDNKVLTNRFDALGRLTNNVFTFSVQTSFAMSFGYDAADRMLWRSYPNGVVQTNTFDTAGRITGLSHSPFTGPPTSSNAINIALNYAYDRNGNKVGSTETGVLRPPMPSLTDEAARFTASGRLIDRQIQNALNPQPSTLNYLYDPSGNMTNASGGGQSFVLSYDEDNRVTALHWDCNLTAVSITNRYDALGRRVAKTADGVESRYVLDLAGSMERILCDMGSAGRITAWYVHAPDLAYRVAPDGSLLCYHADAMANIIATTDGQKDVAAKYAYMPYGRVVGFTNLQFQFSNPYLFVGSQGVMEELPGIYFMRARYYSAEAAVFLSTEPVKPIGPKWKPLHYFYGDCNPLGFSDPRGEHMLRLGWDPDPGHLGSVVNTIPGVAHELRYGEPAFSSLAAFLLTTVHEGVHLLQNELGSDLVRDSLLRGRHYTAERFFQNAMEAVASGTEFATSSFL